MSEQMESEGRRLAQLLDELTGRVLDVSSWSGPDADAFRAGWLQVRARTDAAAARLAATAKELATHAEEQDEASANADSRTGVDGLFPVMFGPGVFGPSALGHGGEASYDLLTANISGDPDDSDGLDNDNDDRRSPDPRTTERTLTQEDADRILHEYQVEADEVTMWELSGWKRDLAEALGYDIPDPVQATEREAELLDGLGPFEMRDFRDNAELATEQTAARYGDENGNDPNPGETPFNDDHADAFRHAYINALTSRDKGEKWATDYWTAHERLPNNDSAREAMDLYNNEVGRRIARENPHASDAELADLVQQAVADGEMVVIDGDGRLVPSNSITPEQAGHPDPDAPQLPGHPQAKRTT